jgi:hypothetical protein
MAKRGGEIDEEEEFDEEEMSHLERRASSAPVYTLPLVLKVEQGLEGRC